MNEERVLEILADMANALEALAVDAKRQIGEITGVSSEQPSNFDGLFWETKKGTKGEYEQTSERANQNSDLWKALKAKVKEHKGFWQSSGFKFWFHQQDETVVDRRKV
jgi:hypothetical protein